MTIRTLAAVLFAAAVLQAEKFYLPTIPCGPTLPRRTWIPIRAAANQ